MSILLSEEERWKAYDAKYADGDVEAVAKAKKILEWGNENCDNPPHYRGFDKLKRECSACWSELQKEIEEG
jgi:uncharacterized protein (DUF983 family)